MMSTTLIVELLDEVRLPLLLH